MDEKLQEIFKQKTEGSEFNLFNASPTKLGKLAHAGSVSSVRHPYMKSASGITLDNEEPDDQLLQAMLEQHFLSIFTNAIAFYDDADNRLDDLDNRIKERLNDIERQTELLEGPNSEEIYQDAQGGFYTLNSGHRQPITDQTTLDSLREQVRAIKASGQSVRTEAEQAKHTELMRLLTDTMDLKSDVRENRQEAETLKKQVENDPSLAPEATERIQQGQDDVKRRLDELDRRVNGLDAHANQEDHQQSFDENPDTPVVNRQLSLVSGSTPTNGFDLS
ncbi:MAG: hypothetical protein KME37_09670 [Candidatus Thiodiazotropha sp. (ex Codakia orbicularis)]|nr:hypothetical protein [Candidatus Thiodiazotropha sp. (ex Codakia orbicularis)]